MKGLTVSILIFISFLVNGQVKKLSIDSDTSFWYKNHVDFVKELGIKEITSFQNDSVFRFWDGNKVVQIEKNSKSYKGDVFFFLREYNGDSQKSERLYSSSMSLDSNTINKILELFSDFKIFEFPSDSKIQGWEKGLDGSTYLTEFNCPNYYSVKSYWTPTVQEKVKEARFLQYFINELNIIDEINDGHKKFMKNQPFESYYMTIDGVVIVTLIK
ncbi:hypothetical protein [Carboxylicivirga caseinilyticus]|uniref:hypothetical protein n=1 Tax=Carboxylicivirga caseinilyticus TaxID=3417572 RepID=UPI003D33CDE5|nr:hypothetical protein [Marinilabiliaceae bacterium A049]